jgi:hypothetical protein
VKPLPNPSSAVTHFGTVDDSTRKRRAPQRAYQITLEFINDGIVLAAVLLFASQPAAATRAVAGPPNEPHRYCTLEGIIDPGGPLPQAHEPGHPADAPIRSSYSRTKWIRTLRGATPLTTSKADQRLWSSPGRTGGWTWTWGKRLTRVKPSKPSASTTWEIPTSINLATSRETSSAFR